MYRNGFAYGPPEAIPRPSGGLARSATDAAPLIYALAIYRFSRSFARAATAKEIYDPSKLLTFGELHLLTKLYVDNGCRQNPMYHPMCCHLTKTIVQPKQC